MNEDSVFNCIWSYHLNVGSVHYIQIEKLTRVFQDSFWRPCEIVCEDFPGI